jgi:hypothetical protein
MRQVVFFFTALAFEAIRPDDPKSVRHDDLSTKRADFSPVVVSGKKFLA